MFGKKFSSNIRRKKRMMISTIILLVVCLGIGYSAFTTDLSIGGTLNVKKYDHTLYGVLEKAVSQGYAKEYTGEHHDSFTSEPSKKIYHWYAPETTAGNNLANEILDKNNVIFAGHCWQMVRTTDTGGVKMVYNGEPENNQCLNTRGNHVGYSNRTYQSMSTTYYYGTSYIYDKTNNVFSLDGTITTGTIQTGQYTCRQTTSTGTCATLYLVDTLSRGTTYYVLPLNGNSNYSQFGALQFNQNYESPSYVGYMYNTSYLHHSKQMISSETVLSTSSLAVTYWYAHNAVWGSPTASRYNLDSPYQVSSTTDYPNLVGEYTFKNETQTYTDTSVYYIAAVNNTTMFYIQLSNSGNHTLSDFNHTYTYGDSFTDNGNGTYTINNPTTVNRSDWYTSYSSIGADKYVCKNASNATCSDLWYTTETTNTLIRYIKVANNYKYSKGFTWDGSKYVLDNDTSTNFWNARDSANITSINNAHYTCWNETGECTTISYIYYSTGEPFYIDITNGKSIENAVNEMLYDDNVNTTNSTIKTGIDAWYKRYMTGYTNKLEDTIFCNDRSQRNASTNGWNPNGGSVTTYLYFNSSNTDLSCTNTTDKFSLSNTKAQLTYPVGLLTYPEIYLLNNLNIRKAGNSYWLGSPYYYDEHFEYVRRMNASGVAGFTFVFESAGVRPAISLKPGTEYASGTGSMDDPYIVEVPMGTLTIQYINELGAVIHEPFVVELPIGATYNYVNPIISGYEATESSATGTLNATSKTHVVRYVDSSGPPLVGD